MFTRAALLVTLFIAHLQAERLPREQLLKYRASDGSIAEATNAAEWSMRGNEIRQAMQKVMGKMPGNEKRCALAVKVEEEADCGSYVRQLISYAAEPGGRVPAYLCIPKSATVDKPAPALLCLHPTENRIGHKVVVGLGGKENRQYASELAERGFVTLSPSYVQLANYQPDLKALGYESGTMKAIWDNIRGLDLLESLPFVNKAPGFAAIGHSLGGHNSIFTAVFDSRIKVVVSSCGFDSFVDYYGGNIKGWTQQRYMPRMANYLGHPQDIPFDFYELIAVLGDRRVFVNAPLRDANFKHDSVDRIAAAARPVFKLLGGMLTVVHPDSEHDFPDEARLESYRVIESVLKPRP
jgi:dienelactone hydrolase